MVQTVTSLWTACLLGVACRIFFSVEVVSLDWFLKVSVYDIVNLVHVFTTHHICKRSSICHHASLCSLVCLTWWESRDTHSRREADQMLFIPPLRLQIKLSDFEILHASSVFYNGRLAIRPSGLLGYNKYWWPWFHPCHGCTDHKLFHKLHTFKPRSNFLLRL